MTAEVETAVKLNNIDEKIDAVDKLHVNSNLMMVNFKRALQKKYMGDKSGT